MATLLPGWNSVDAAARWHRGFEIAGFIALALLLLFEILAYIYGNRKDVLLAGNEQRASESRRQQEQQENQKRDSEVEEARGKAAEAQAKVRELEAANKSRQLSDNQATELREALSGHPGWNVLIVTQIGDQEATDYARGFSAAFNKAGWNVLEFYQRMTFDPPISGMSVMVADKAHPPAEAEAILKALKQAKIEVAEGVDSGGYKPTGGERFYLVIGRKKL